jgi:hypothetical protein
MKISKLVAGAGLALTLAAFSPAAFAQAPGSNPGSETNNAATMNQESPHQEARQIKDRITSEEQSGKDVSTARHEYKLGMHELNKGNEAEARQHFEQAENDLGMQENNENGAASSTVPSSGNWNNHSGGNGNE